MRKNYHITNIGELRRQENTLVFDPDTESEKKHIPIKNVDAIYAHEELRFNTKLFQLLDEHTVELHLFSWGGQYVGGYVPTKSTMSGDVIVEQVQSYLHPERRRDIAQSIVASSMNNMEKTLRYYDEYDINEELETIEEMRDIVLSEKEPVDTLMGYEGDSRTAYYSGLQKVIPSNFNFETRSYNPPSSDFNALLSFGNSLLYGTVSSAIQSTALNPTVSFLHEPSARRHSLSLDIADIFKPVITDRLILRLVNRKQITPNDFTEDWLLEEDARKTMLSKYEELLEETVEHKELERNVSYQYLIKLDVLDLKKHILTGEEYTPFERWW